MNRAAHRTRGAALAGLFAVLLLAAGCGREEKLTHVSGTVTYDGDPVPEGNVFFDPVAGAKGQGFATIKNGTFDTAQGGTGLGQGKFLVRVLGYDGKDRTVAPLGKGLFPEYTLNHEQAAENSTLDIKVPKAPKGK